MEQCIRVFLKCDVGNHGMEDFLTSSRGSNVNIWHLHVVCLFLISAAGLHRHSYTIT